MPTPAIAPSRALPALSVLFLVATFVFPRLPGAQQWVGALVLGACGLSAAVVLPRRARRPEPVVRAPGSAVRRAARAVLDMLLYLSPVLLLTLAFPFAVARIASDTVAGVPLTTLLLASSLTVPWLSAATCMPLYRAVGSLLPDGDLNDIRDRFCAVWPMTFAQTAPAVLLFAVPLELVMRWPVVAWLAYVGLALLHSAFAQSLVLANIGRQRFVWAGAWVSYTVALLLVPALWFLPPVLGLLSQLVPLRRHLPRLRSRARLEHGDVAVDVGRGLLLGAVLWGHFLLIFLKTQGQFPVTALFTGALAAVVAYNYYFVRMAPGFDRAVTQMRSAMEGQPHRLLQAQSKALGRVVDGSLQRTGALCAALGLVITVVAQQASGRPAVLVGTVAVASWLFMMTTLACYKLDYIGQRAQAQAFSGAHLALTAGAFAVLSPGPALYAWIAGLSSVVFVGALRACRQHWSASDYALFWRHATAW